MKQVQQNQTVKQVTHEQNKLTDTERYELEQENPILSTHYL